MIKIRLARHGTKKRPFYKIVVADSRFPRNGRFIEYLGYFNPISSGKDKKIEFNKEKIENWIKNGAKLSERVEKIIK